MRHRTLARAQLVFASLAVLLAGLGGWWSWRVGNRHGVTVAVSIVLITGVSSVLMRLATRAPRDHSV